MYTHLCCFKTSASSVIQQHHSPEFLPVKLTLTHQLLQLFQTYRHEFLVTPCLEKKIGKVKQMLMKSYPKWSNTQCL